MTDSSPPEPQDAPSPDPDFPGGDEGRGAREGASEDAARGGAVRPTPVRAPRPVGGPPGRPTTPKPVRAGLERENVDPAGTLTSPEEVELEVGDATLTVRVRGRSRGRAGHGAADLLLLGFHRPDEDEPCRDALVVGQSLEALTPMELAAAWTRGREPRDPFEPSDLFPGTRRKRGGGRGR